MSRVLNRERMSLHPSHPAFNFFLPTPAAEVEWSLGGPYHRADAPKRKKLPLQTV